MEERKIILNGIQDLTDEISIELQAIIDNLVPAIQSTVNTWVAATEQGTADQAWDDFFTTIDDKTLISEVEEAEATDLVHLEDFVLINIKYHKFDRTAANAQEHVNFIAVASEVNSSEGNVFDPPQWKRNWLNNHPDGGYEETIQRTCNRLIAHELRHAYFYHQENKLQGFIWSFLEEQGIDEQGIEDDCYGNDGQCTETPGHSYQNPDGINACDEENEYAKPELPPD